MTHGDKEKYMADSAGVEHDEQIGDFLRRGNRLWIAPPRTLLPEMDEEPADPWFYVGPMPEGYNPKVQRRVRT